MIINADCLEAMHEIEAASIDSIVTDPPYGLAFMGVAWDTFGKGGARTDATFDQVGGNHHPTCAADQARTRRLARWCNRAWIRKKCRFEDYV